MAFTDKVKVINTYIPQKAKIYIENNLLDEINYFQKKYSFEIRIISNDEFVIPEYKIELLNKSKKLINSIENINKIIKLNKIKDIYKKGKKGKSKEIVKSKDKVKKTKTKKKIRTLWVRRKKKN